MVFECPVQPANTAAMRAELHRQSIARMRVSYYSHYGMLKCPYFLVY